MTFMNIIFIRAAVLVIVFFTGNAVQAESGVVVKPIDEATLGKLILADDNRLVLSFMAAWCGPCIDELPALKRLYKKYKDRGLQIIGISIDFAGPAAMQPVVEKLKIDFK